MEDQDDESEVGRPRSVSVESVSSISTSSSREPGGDQQESSNVHPGKFDLDKTGDYDVRTRDPTSRLLRRDSRSTSRDRGSSSFEKEKEYHGHQKPAAAKRQKRDPDSESSRSRSPEPRYFRSSNGRGTDDRRYPDPGGRHEQQGRGKDSNYREREGHSRDSRQRTQQSLGDSRPRERSLSPFSRRLAMTRGDDIGGS